MTIHAGADFYENLTPVKVFADVLVSRNATALPDDWIVGVADVVSSTRAIAEGRYKAVNMVGASVISSVRNALDGRIFPFVFGGDGAGFAIAPDDRAVVEEALAACPVWAREEIGLELRTALVPLTDIRRAGHDVRVVRHSPGPDVSYAMFSGGGMAWAEEQMKLGAYAVAEADPGSRPDLEGLSCRWAPLKAEHGEIVSLIVVPAGGTDRAFNRVMMDVLGLLGENAGGGRPVRDEGPKFALPSPGIDLETRAQKGKKSYLVTRLKLQAVVIFAWLLDRTRTKFKGFDAAHYRAQTAENTDFRKFDDGLKLTVDCSPELTARIEARLEKARKKGHCHYGIHRQSNALMTCIVPSPFDEDHMHFVDGGAGGYAQAAVMLKSQIAAAALAQS